ncbi:mechanosensitive ion channel family protein [Pseudaquabacterium rugosum]|uniref:Mechanosensitive ion channel domain-containing protein n=1 Tax=Pseudaquabacterium rugosum TaxID=2984194 RepID=A0ABU9B775_9BURK
MNVLDRLSRLVTELLSVSSLTGLAILAVCLLVSGLLVHRLSRLRAADVAAQTAADEASGAAPRGPAGAPHVESILLGERGLDGVLFPAAALGLAALARVFIGDLVAPAVFRLAIPLLLSLTVIRGTVRVLHAAFPASRLVRYLERTVSWLVWAALVLWLTELLAPTLEALESVSWKIGGSPVSLRSLLEGALTAIVVLLAMLWLSASIESRLLRAEAVNLSVRKMAANAVRALLLVIGVLVAMSAAGIPLGALSVLGGAIGVGLGFGLQKLAANYVSGFVILAERSLRIGDVVKVDGFEGRISDITTRYTVLRAPNGRESIVPNELLITQRVENCSFADTKVALTTVVEIAYGSDLEALTPVLQAAIAAVPRVLQDPGPAVLLSGFGANGLQLTCAYWIADLDRGEGGVKDGVNRAILRTLDRQGIEIPYPQQVVRAAPGSEAALKHLP